ncbi:type II toxin-antitoxin system RelE/ParE family toxin [Lunatimonas salinarum]|uniref:type II toxin-antitoxin system RelE/ParE family toxin n=1 Tax=Lunatimonas salinarum TaxID=1774590 RepID=UPI001ADF16E9|nr:type II toxin-antitoxin system RelE/ParE family toxin [Lunatimonas salinarum]
MNVRFLRSAKFEIDESYAYYESKRVGLGKDFMDEVYYAVKRITDNPMAWSQLSQRTRRCLVNRFPFGIIYQIRDHEILVLAVAHLHRKPRYWNS